MNETAIVDQFIHPKLVDGNGNCGACPFRAWDMCTHPEADKAKGAIHPVGQHLTMGKGDFFTLGEFDQDVAFAVTRGSLKLSKSLPDGRTQAIGFRFAGDLALAFPFEGPADLRIKALADSELCRVELKMFRDARKSDSALDAFADQIFRKEVLAAHEHMMTLGRRDPLEKLATFLLEIDGRVNGGRGSRVALSLPMTRADIADYLGLESETISRLFTRLKKQGHISLLSPSSVVIEDQVALRDIAFGVSQYASFGDGD